MGSQKTYLVDDPVAGLASARSAISDIGLVIEDIDTSRFEAWEAPETRGADSGKLYFGDARAKGSPFLGVEVAALGNELVLTRLSSGRRSGFVGRNRNNERWRLLRKSLASALTAQAPGQA